jgi:hypothetical protein
MVASIAYIENIVATFGRASEANRQTPGREGNLIVLTPELADEVMITGDLHGHRRNFNLIKRIAALESHPRRHLVLQEVCHGGPTYPQNGGCMSHTLLEDVAKLKVAYPDRVHFLLGNHELAELTDYPIQKNKQMLNLLFRLGLQQMYGPATDKVRESFFPFLRSCPLALRSRRWGVQDPPSNERCGMFVSHSVPEYVDLRQFDTTIFTRDLDEGDFFGRGAIFQLVWGRDYRQENARAFADQVGAEVLINGHEPCPDGFSAPNDTQIIIDCCGEQACYVVLSTDRQWNQAEIIEQIKRLA